MKEHLNGYAYCDLDIYICMYCEKSININNNCFMYMICVYISPLLLAFFDFHFDTLKNGLEL